jgi:ComF family protein
MWRKIIGGLRDIIYPPRCLACKTPLVFSASGESFVCAKCLGGIKKNLPPFCSRCGRHLKKNNLAKNVCTGCARTTLHFDRAFSPLLYEGAIKELLHEFKYKGKDYLGATLSSPMLEFIREYHLPLEYLDLIVPVPLHNSKLREREFNQAQVLGNFIAREFHKELRDDILIRNRATLTQTELEIGKRLNNVKDCFSVRDTDTVKEKNILLVDDVLTTGATCSEAALALKKSGAGIVFALTLAN